MNVRMWRYKSKPSTLRLPRTRPGRESGHFGYELRADNDCMQVRNLVINGSLNAKAKKLTILLGHNDYCNGYGTYSSWPAKGLCTGQRNNCMELSDGADRDPDYYCSIRPSAYERELRQALGIAATIPNMTVELASPVRVSQLCGLRDIAKNTLLNKDRPITCRQFDNVLNTESYLVNLFKSQPQPGVCKPLTYVDNR